MQLCNVGHNFDYETEKVVRIFLPDEKINISHEEVYAENTAVCILSADLRASAKVNFHGKESEKSETLKSGASEKEKELAVARCLYTPPIIPPFRVRRIDRSLKAVALKRRNGRRVFLPLN